jgi:hypothetical protein
MYNLFPHRAGSLPSSCLMDDLPSKVTPYPLESNTEGRDNVRVGEALERLR